LKVLASKPYIDTVTPAVISRVNGRCEGLKIRLSTEIKGGFKLIARRGSSAQEVFVVTKLSQAAFKELLGAID
jgi:hypothetical protein